MKTPGTDTWRYRREPRPYHPDDVGLSALAAAIVQQAVEDYRDAEKWLKNVPDFDSEADRERYILKQQKSQYEIVKFFKSEWYGVLCDIDPNRILKLLGVRS
jgi:hypothetical protein